MCEWIAFYTQIFVYKTRKVKLSHAIIFSNKYHEMWMRLSDFFKNLMKCFKFEKN